MKIVYNLYMFIIYHTFYAFKFYSNTKFMKNFYFYVEGVKTTGYNKSYLLLLSILTY